jgi:uncharacterized protein
MTTDTYDYDWLSDLLSELGLSSSAAHVHGSLVGYLVAGGPMATRASIDQVLNAEPQESDSDQPAPDAAHSLSLGDQTTPHWLCIVLSEHDLELPDATEEELEGFARATLRQLALEDMRLELLLPDDMRDLAERAAGLTDWCSGFLGGVGLAGFNQVKLLSKDGREGLRDLERIARTEVELDEDEDGNENALMELCEFAKVTALMLMTEIQVASKPKIASKGFPMGAFPNASTTLQ